MKEFGKTDFQNLKKENKMKILKQSILFFLCFILINITQNVSAQTANAKTGTLPIGAADGVAIWIHPGNPSKSMIIGANPGIGLGTFNLNGSLIEVVNFGIGGAGEVDVRYNFPLDGKKIPIIVSANNKQNI